ncbi:hypothetical protein [Prosthecobacter sp.]|uniref:hypothetical protein n=1 Tax=Prosthecobacter sp. TaxID=1965333 RepID=UPI003784D309
MKTFPAILALCAAFALCLMSAWAEETGKETSPALTFHIVSNIEVEGWKRVDLPGHRQHGYISPDADLVLRQLKRVELYKKPAVVSGGQQLLEGVSGIRITLLDEDAAAFTAMSRRAVKHQVLVLLGDKPLMAPIMMSPITEPVFDIQTRNGEDKELHETLMKLVKK